MNLVSCAKLAPKYCVPFEVLNRVALVAYKIALLANNKAHDVFHVSSLKKYVYHSNHEIDWDVIQRELEGEVQISHCASSTGK